MPLESKPGTLRIEISDAADIRYRQHLIDRIEAHASTNNLFFYRDDSPRTGDTIITITPYDRNRQTIDIMDTAMLGVLKAAASAKGRSIQDMLTRMLAEVEADLAKDDMPDYDNHPE